MVHGRDDIQVKVNIQSPIPTSFDTTVVTLVQKKKDTGMDI